MKKVFLLLSVIGLAFASCTPNGGNEGGDTQGAGEFVIEVTNIAASSAHIKVSAKEATRTFYANMLPKAEFASYDLNELHAELVELVESGRYTWEDLLSVGSEEWDTTRVVPNAEFVVYAFGVDTNGNLTSSAVSYKSFKTPESTFDTASWAGWWMVTSPMTYTQQENLLTEEYEETWTDDELVRPIEIIDGASIDASMEGYAVIYGWDGFFLYDGPAIGVYNDNKIELLNNEIVYQDEDGSVYQWIAQSVISAPGNDSLDGVNTIVGGEYAPYTFTMDANGAVAIDPYKGAASTTAGDQVVFTVCAFTIFPVVGEEIYVWKYSEPAYTFSGEGITAAKTTAPEDSGIAPAKLSKKNIKVMHKMANQKFVTKTFTAARFVK